jgi:hypothetical protein
LELAQAEQLPPKKREKLFKRGTARKEVLQEMRNSDPPIQYLVGAFKILKGDLAIRPNYHKLESRIEAHIFIAILGYCLHATLGCRLKALAPGLTPRSVLDKFAAVQMIDVHIPTADGRELVLTRVHRAGEGTQPASWQTEARAARTTASWPR